MAFTVHAVMPGVWHIVDCMGVCMTLLEGENAAMLVDTGYGIEDVADFMRHMTDLPLTVFLTHNHHDHAMGARCFPETYMLEADMADWRMFTNDEMRRRVLTQAIGKNLPVDEKTFLAGEIPLPKVMKPGVIDLGGLTAEIIEAPGHTPVRRWCMCRSGSCCCPATTGTPAHGSSSRRRWGFGSTAATCAASSSCRLRKSSVRTVRRSMTAGCSTTSSTP